MDSRFFFFCFLLLLLNLDYTVVLVNGSGAGVFKVSYKFAGSERTLSALRAHDVRHLNILAGVDLPLGGTGRPDAVGLYYAKIGIGTPPKDYYVQVDTGSDITWVNCIQCHECPKRGYHGIELTLYDPNDSLTGKLVTCDREFCKEISRSSFSGCSANSSCLYTEGYGDGSYSMGYFVEDIVQYDRVSGDLQTKLANGSVIFGPHYNVNMTAVQVGLDYLNLTTDIYTAGDNNGAIIDSGTTLAYLPEVIYVPLVKKILSWQMDLKLRTLHDIYTCFDYSGSVDDAFPPVTFHFENSLHLKVYPGEYLFPFEDLMCLGFQNSGMQSQDKQNITLLGDLVLSNKLVLYDLVNQTIGWTEYNCSSSIKVKDELTGSVHLVGAHSLSRGCILNVPMVLFSLLLMALLHGFLTELL
ncbi:aspartic proteinase-like protein 2 isoform X2 [Olea europaea var. sylvestris]|uniref:aspartic proteinase-like protein 2 isoform X2 n=1 Tax=Olea europaea var. sylvestris TaxID=158386 RepID=UPI000C1D321B|nr:aspartic proteinase-like protein 2 isoform X2 [Olea europaea var. sylvestris]